MFVLVDLVFRSFFATWIISQIYLNRARGRDIDLNVLNQTQLLLTKVEMNSRSRSQSQESDSSESDNEEPRREIPKLSKQDLTDASTLLEA